MCGDKESWDGDDGRLNIQTSTEYQDTSMHAATQALERPHIPSEPHEVSLSISASRNMKHE